MKKLIISAFVIFCATVTFAQKIAYINTETILGELDEYAVAQSELNELSDKYKATIETEAAKLDELYRSYQEEKISMTQSERVSKENEIISKERSLKEKQEIYFGEDGIMADRSNQLLNPIQQKVNSAIAKIAAKDDYVMIIDIAATPGVVYKNSKYDLTQQVINILK